MKRTTLILGLLLMSGLTYAQDSLSALFWAVEHQALIKNNHKYMRRLFQRFERGQIIGVELIIAASTNNQIESRFGHTLVRFVDSVGGPGDDITLSFVADVTTAKLNYLGGVLGKYALYPQVQSLRLFYRNYQKHESRSLEHIIVPTSQESRARLINTLKDWWQQVQSGTPEVQLRSLEKSYKRARKSARELLGKAAFSLQLVEDNQAPQGIAIVEGNYPKLNKHELNQLLFRQSQARLVSALKRKFPHALVAGLGPSVVALADDQAYPRRPLGYDPHLFAKELAKNFDGQQFILLWTEQELVAVPSDGKTFAATVTVHATQAVVPLIEPILQMGVKTRSMGAYTFLNNNCAGAVVRYFKAAGFPYRRWRWLSGRIPIKLSRYFAQGLLAPYPSTMTDKALRAHERFRQLGLLPWQSTNAITASTMLEDDEMWILLDLVEEMPVEDQLLIRSTLDRPPRWETLYGLPDYPQNLYTICKTRACADQLTRDLQSFFSKDELSKTLNQTARRLDKSFEGLHVDQQLRQHYRLLGL